MQEIIMDEPITRHEFNMLQDNIKEYRHGVRDQIEEINRSLKAMWTKMDGRPSWSVLVIISLLSSLVVGLSVVLVK